MYNASKKNIITKCSVNNIYNLINEQFVIAYFFFHQSVLIKSVLVFQVSLALFEFDFLAEIMP